MENEIKFIDKKIKKIDATLEATSMYLKSLRDERQNLESCKKAILQNNGWKDEAKILLTKILGETKELEKPTKEIEKFKICTKCNEILPATTNFFNPRKNGKDGLHTQCKKCLKKYQNKYKNKKRKEKPNQLSKVPYGWDIYKNFLSKGYVSIEKVIKSFVKKYPKHNYRTRENYIKQCQIYAEDKLGFKYESKRINGIYHFRLYKSLDIPISNGTKENALPLINSSTKDKKIINWNRFKLHG